MTKTKKPKLVKVGNHFININDVSGISKVKSNTENKELYVVRFISNPNPEHTCWVNKNDIEFLLEQFEIVVSDN